MEIARAEAAARERIDRARRVLVSIALASAGVVSGCSTAEPPTARTASASAGVRPLPAAPAGSASTPSAPPSVLGVASTTPVSRAGVVEAAPPPAPRPMPPPWRADPALTLLSPPGEPGCRDADEAARLRCRIDHRWSAVADVGPIALELWDRHRVVVGLEPEHWMDGGFRGRLHLVPQVPTGRHARHVGWVRDAHAVMAHVLDDAARRASNAAPRRFRHEGVVYGFFRSVGRTTPSAYASDWRIGYNVSGSLLGTRDGVIETLFHEIFHLNDQGDRWSETHLRPIHEAIVARCGARNACLAPFAPTRTVVRGGTFYSFQPDNGDAVHEYAAEVATRWFQEHRAIVEATPSSWPTPFKCGPPENAQAWDAVADGFFGGVDLVPPCSEPGR